MNRFRPAIRPKRPGLDAALPPSFAIESAFFAPASPTTARALFAPQHYERNYAYPLIVWLHDAEDDEWQLLRVMPLVSMRNYVAVAPRGLPVPGAAGRVHWGWSQAPDHVDQAQRRVFDAVEEAAGKYHVHPHRIFLVGVGCGGTMALRLATQWPNRFAGVASIGGPLPDASHAPLNQWVDVRRLPVLLEVGRQDPAYPPTRACEDLRLMRSAGFFSITLREYHPCEYPLIPHALRDLDRWIMELVAAPSNAATVRDHWSSCLPE